MVEDEIGDTWQSGGSDKSVIAAADKKSPKNQGSWG
jgi:hypothetical protein